MGKSFRTLVGETMGEASVTLWDETPKGIFNSSKAIELTNRIVLAHVKIVAETSGMAPDKVEKLLITFSRGRDGQ